MGLLSSIDNSPLNLRKYLSLARDLQVRGIFSYGSLRHRNENLKHNFDFHIRSREFPNRRVGRQTGGVAETEQKHDKLVKTTS